MMYMLGIHSYKLVRGASDLGGVANRVTARSRYGGEHLIVILHSSDSSLNGLRLS